jgi:hypothetical protein
MALVTCTPLKPSMPFRSSAVAAHLLVAVIALHGTGAGAQTRARAIQNVDVQKLANGILGIMSYTVAPDVTTSSLAIGSAETANPGLSLSQVGGGFTFSKSTPLYMEGNAAYSRYDPVFLASDGATQRPVPVKWNSLSATGGIGWDFRLSERWVLRPILNFMVGYVASDLEGLKWWVDNNTNLDLSFLDGRKLKAYGLGGSLMLDYEKFTPEADDDLEIRYTQVNLGSYGDSPSGVVGHAKATSASIWARRRVPTGWGVVWDRPVRYVYEAALTEFLGDQREVGINWMASLGFGLELDSSALDRWATRWRAVLRYKFGPDVKGAAFGVAISF